MISVLSKLLGFQHLPLAEDIVQDTLLKAMTTWPYNGVPDNPRAWLYRVARNKAVDLIRRQKIFRQIQPELASEYSLSATVNQLFESDEMMDSQLCMMFACCHPSISAESQIALVLKTLCGLNNAEIAKAFLKDEEAIAKRIYRAKEKIRSEKIALELPHPSQMSGRLAAVLHSLYLLFNEGYYSSHPEHIIRESLCEEAMRLVYLLTQHPQTRDPRTYALLALFCFQASRLAARLDDKGNILLLKYQDRTRWYQPLITKGLYFLETATGDTTSVYHLEAAIAWLHASAPDFASTNWTAIYHLYGVLSKHQTSDIISLNKAIAASYALNRQIALKELKQIKGLDNHHLYHTALGEIYFDEGRLEDARACYLKAISLASTQAELQLLHNKLAAC
jgi:RNA polymerase sigma-70 factor (ECF subfamily)